MDSSKSLEENLDEFKKIIVSLTNIDEIFFDENQAIIILDSLADSFKDLKATINYGRESNYHLMMFLVLLEELLRLSLKRKGIQKACRLKEDHRKGINQRLMASQDLNPRERGPIGIFIKKDT